MPARTESVDDWIVREAQRIAGPQTQLQDVDAVIHFGQRVAAYVRATGPDPVSLTLPDDVLERLDAWKLKHKQPD